MDDKIVLSVSEWLINEKLMKRWKKHKVYFLPTLQHPIKVHTFFASLS